MKIEEIKAPRLEKLTNDVGVDNQEKFEAKNELKRLFETIETQTKTIRELEERVKELEEESQLNISCRLFINDNTTAANCSNCGKPKHEHNF